MVQRRFKRRIIVRLTKHRRVQSINERNEDRRCHDNQEKMAQQEVGAPEGHFHDLDDVFTSRLRDGRCAETTTVPLSRPPCQVCLIVFELTGKEDGDEDLLYGTLNGNDRDDAQHGVRSVPELQEPLVAE